MLTNDQARALIAMDKNTDLLTELSPEVIRTDRIDCLERELRTKTMMIEQLAEKLAEMNILANGLADNLYALIDHYENKNADLLRAHLDRLSGNRKKMQKAEVH